MEVKLGFGAVPRPQYVFVSREPDHCWYMLAEDEKRIPIYERALTGVITGIEINKKVENTFGEVIRTDLNILADKPYIIRSGSDTYFCKGLLLSLDILTFEQLRHPLTITVSPGDKKVVFCNIYDPATYRSIGVSWDGYREIDWQALGQKVSLKINKIHNFNQDKNQSQPEISDNIKTVEPRDVFITQTDTYLTQLNWTPEQGRDYLQQKYGKRSRLQLTDTEILDFIDYLKLQLT
ncbi:hypothetical protein [Nostoc sp. 'Lobaria pulmonaria (5183) cyanobiont']|uniref:hypothetical protein n=1 Tax=Nostoc sp. 'Lobaria pulmonaria (5183) cyanobiont' TaxID=1618022 RepID=UPI000CF35EE1|nr:hypothetical protein [Nostoc sp. 'Lobaria pulmonaria (5183) cyanobiont']AVH71382.1 hypothetical protein NLP_2745 [Nostoc sp. 'Lobaria pulmonaria (5183) cyanobiont']